MDVVEALSGGRFIKILSFSYYLPRVTLFPVIYKTTKSTNVNIFFKYSR